MESRNKIYTTLAIFVILSLFLIVFFIWPIFKEIKRNSGDFISAKNSMVALKLQADEIKFFKDNYQAYKPNLDKIDQMFVDENNPVDFFKFLEDTAYNSQITSQISLPSASSGDQQSIIFQFSSKGSFSNVLDFTKKIEAGPYFCEIENLSIKNSSDKNILADYSSREVNAGFTIKVFTKK